MDLKIIGKNDTCLNQNLIVFDMIETRSRFAFSKVIKNSSKQEILTALDEGIKYLQSHGVVVRIIQTDNAMMFKGNNFVMSDSYNEFLMKRKIIKRLIPLREPQCNGCVERYHRTIDDKCYSLLASCKTFERAIEIINRFLYEYNFNRYHYYSELENQNVQYAKRFMMPMDAIKMLYNFCEVDYI